jgi:hypothetical protein
VRPSTTYANIHWTLDGKPLLHNAAIDDRSNVWLQPLSGGPARQITRFADQIIFGLTARSTASSSSSRAARSAAMR